MRRFLIAGNWKMNKTAEEAKAFFAELKSLLSANIKSELLICPTFTALNEAYNANKGLISLGAQNVYPKDSGAFTGEISPKMLAEFVSYVIVGHSERRTILGESNEFINEKIHALLKNGLNYDIRHTMLTDAEYEDNLGKESFFREYLYVIRGDING